MSVEELEAVRLADQKGLSAAEAARLMGISRHTFGRVLKSARLTIAEALVTGKALRIEGGNWVFADQSPTHCRALDNYNRSCSGSGQEEGTE